MTLATETTLSQQVTRFVHLPVTSDLDSFLRAAEAANRIVIRPSAPSATDRGRLGRYLCRATATQLSELGAPRTTSDSPLNEALPDLIYRARLLGATGLALALPDLTALADTSQALVPPDCQTLRTLVAGTERWALQLYIPIACAELLVMDPAHPLSQWLPESPASGGFAYIEHEDDDADAPPTRTAPDPNGKEPEPGLLPPDPRAFVKAPPVQAAGNAAPASTGEQHEHPVPNPEASSTVSVEKSLTSTEDSNRPGVSHTPVYSTQAQRRSWASRLGSLSGPKSRASIEGAFVEAYVPLQTAVCAGEASSHEMQALSEFRESFAQSYRAAFGELEHSSQRPMMLNDMPMVGARWGAKHRAQAVRFLSVPALRFDLHSRLANVIPKLLGTHCTRIENGLIWTPPDVPEDECPRDGDEEPSEITGRDKHYRLTTLLTDLRAEGEGAAARLERLAVTLAEHICPWLEEQPRGTLVVLFGEYGFRWQCDTQGSSAGRTTGAAPEQVLAPVSAWLAQPPSGGWLEKQQRLDDHVHGEGA